MEVEEPEQTNEEFIDSLISRPRPQQPAPETEAAPPEERSLDEIMTAPVSNDQSEMNRLVQSQVNQDMARESKLLAQEEEMAAAAEKAMAAPPEPAPEGVLGRQLREIGRSSRLRGLGRLGLALSAIPGNLPIRPEAVRNDPTAALRALSQEGTRRQREREAQSRAALTREGTKSRGNIAAERARLTSRGQDITSSYYGDRRDANEASAANARARTSLMGENYAAQQGIAARSADRLDAEEAREAALADPRSEESALAVQHYRAMLQGHANNPTSTQRPQAMTALADLEREGGGLSANDAASLTERFTGGSMMNRGQMRGVLRGRGGGGRGGGGGGEDAIRAAYVAQAEGLPEHVGHRPQLIALASNQGVTTEQLKAHWARLNQSLPEAVTQYERQRNQRLSPVAGYMVDPTVAEIEVEPIQRRRFATYVAENRRQRSLAREIVRDINLVGAGDIALDAIAQHPDVLGRLRSNAGALVAYVGQAEELGTLQQSDIRFVREQIGTDGLGGTLTMMNPGAWNNMRTRMQSIISRSAREETHAAQALGYVHVGRFQRRQQRERERGGGQAQSGGQAQGGGRSSLASRFARQGNN